MKAKKSDCRGCVNDCYNHGFNGVEKCWSLEEAIMERKYDIHVDQQPPYKGMKATSRPSCYKQNRYVRVDPKSINKKGFWV